MQIIENNLIKEKVYIEKLESGITIMCIPKEKAIKKLPDEFINILNKAYKSVRPIK